MIVFLLIVIYVIGIASAVHAVMSTRTPQGAIAWAVSLVAIPYISVPAYWIFGRNKFQGYVLARKKDLESLGIVARRARDNVLDQASPGQISAPATQAAEKLARVPVTLGNQATLLVDGEATFESIFRGIEAAEHYLLVQFYIVRDDKLGNRLKSHLIEKARQGVHVYFLYDEIGSLALPDTWLDEMRAAGVNVSAFHSRKGRGNRFQLNFRNHRKIVVADGDRAWLGGLNVGDEYMGESPEFGNWRDTHIRIEGPAAVGAQLSFAEDWHWATDQVLANLAWDPGAAENPGKSALVLSSGPADQLETASLMYTHAINSARERLWIATPYFVPDDATVNALQLAALRGVDVRVLIPDKTDSVLVGLAAYSYLEETGAAGVRLYRYTGGFMHQKVMLVDDAVSMIGTANFDNRSFRLNFEITAIVGDEDFAAQVENMLEEDMEHSRVMTYEDFVKRPWWSRLAVRMARLAAPVL